MRIHFTRITMLLTTALALISTISEAQNLPSWLPSNGLVAYYPFNGDAGDSSGNQLHGMLLGGVTFTSGRNGQPNSAASFNGTTTYVEIQDDPKLRFRNGTVVYWIKTSAVSAQTIITKSNYTNANNEMYTTSINFPSIGNVGAAAKYNSNCQGGVGWRNNQTAANINDNNWNMIAVTFRSDSIVIYKNGQKINAVSTPLTRMDSCAGGTFRIGRNWSGANSSYSGQLDEMCLFNRVLSNQEILDIYNGCPQKPVINYVGNTTFCSGDTLTLNSSYNSGNSWSTGSNANSIRVTQTGIYTVSTSNANCTSISDPVIVTVVQKPATPVISANGPTTICSGNSVVLTSSSSTNNLWSNGSNNQSITVTQSGTFTVVVNNSICSSTSAPISVIVNPTPPTPTIAVQGPTTFCSGNSVTLSSSSSTGNTWSNSSTNQSIQVTQSGVFTVTVSLGNCSSTSLPTTITVLPGVSITNQPINTIGFLLSSTKFTVGTTNSTNNNFQWQTNLGFGFQNISNAGQYNGANDDTLEISNLSISNNNQLFRCIITRGTCVDTTNTVALTVTQGVSVNEANSDKLRIYPIPTQNELTIDCGTLDELVPFELISIEGKILHAGVLNSGLNHLSMQNLPKGIYMLKANGKIQRLVKVIKN